MHPSSPIIRLPVLWLTTLIVVSQSVAALGDEISFARHVRPILADACFACHGPDATQRQSELRLDNSDNLFLEINDSTAVVPGQPDASALVQRITSADPDLQMPPPDAVRRLRQQDIETLTAWIAQGAVMEPHWAFRRPVKPPIPEIDDHGWCRNPIDHFVLAGLNEVGLQPSPPADRATLLRRVSLDLTGLPPTLEDIDAFLEDSSPNAFETVVDRLLASPRYGEHQAVAWLDAARYADTDGYQNDRLRYQWVWRDWVIQAFNNNLRYDQFTIEQLAGDLLPDATFRQQVATGFNRNHRINSEGGSIPDEWLVEYVVDRVDTLGTVWLGLTVQCARCHDHKYDPISQREYYQLFATFHQVDEWGLGPNNGNSPPFVTVPKSWPDLSPDDDQAQTPEPLKITVTQTSVPRPQPGGTDTVMVMHDRTEPRTTWLLKRGVYNQPDPSVELHPSVPAALGSWPDGAPRNRLGLARWLVDPAHPLTARVAVNRFWQQLFGTGIVRTAEDFGVQGEPPVHPELLDWLAVTFVESGWDIKALQKRIVMSATYQQSSAVTPVVLERDPENRLLARGPRTQLTAHVTRDLALAVSGLLVEQIGGPSVFPYMPPKIWSSMSNNKYKQDHGDALYRRSMYTYWRRTIPPPTLMAFNAADRDVCLVRKPRIVTPQQALALMNNITFVEAARFLAERILHESETSDAQRIAFGFRLTTAHYPDDARQQVLLTALQAFRDEFRAAPAAADELLGVGEKPRDSGLDPVEHAAWTMLASLLLNLDQTVMKD